MAPLVISSCSSGKKAYEQGNYYSATLKAVNRLRQKPTHKKSQETLQYSYPLAIETLERDATNRLAGISPFKYKEALGMYQQLNSLHDQIRRSPGALKIIPNPKNYSSKIAVLKEKAAEESYQAAVILLDRNTREDAKQAYYLFQDVQGLMPGYKEVMNKMDEAKFIATLKVVVEQIPVPTIYDLSARFFQDKISEYLHTQYRSNEFVRFYTPAEKKNENLTYADQYLRLQFDDFTIGETHMTSHTETVSKDSVVVGKVTVEDGTTLDAYNTVSAKLTTNRKEIVSRGLVSMKVYDGNGSAVLSHNKFPGEFVWISEWASFNGDERALTDKQLKLCTLSEATPPPPQDMFIEFTRPIYEQVVQAVNGFYSKY